MAIMGRELYDVEFLHETVLLARIQEPCRRCESAVAFIAAMVARAMPRTDSSGIRWYT